eukprot:TRINITY_DN47529_c0_g1_i1.p1 TRINITY_DN47529_c0_g1~~TRINITY_DN47529_c0_g1_i1.p1  ORF type:complete len:229 (-),score=34.31 TRINITY_DN47529_c0_g1_i1:26-712(-)
MLNSKYPDPTELNTWLNNFSEHKRFIAHSIGRDSRWKPPRNAKLPGPGAYKTDRDYPEHERHDMGTHAYSRVPPKYSIPTESRTAPDGTMKGISLSPNKAIQKSLGPGQYPLHRIGTKSAEKEFITLTFPKAKETAEALRERKKTSDVPSPGAYNLKRYGDDLGQEKTKIIERAVKRGTRCWASGQYSHIYQCMKPRSNSMPVLPPAAAAAESTAQPSQEQAAPAAAS